ncbi:MAG TPA: response regulator transcription factor [Acidimicrobiia bacterium]|nr:response regulator transcription factor [Acidimicrobiia bacterium]
MTERAIIRVFLADDHPVVRQGLRTFLESRPGIEVVGEAGDGDAAVDEVARLRPDVVLMDLVMPGGGGVVAIRCIRERAPETRVVVLTSFASDDQVIPAVQAGAAGYLLKDVEPSGLEAAIRLVHDGEALLDPQIAGRVMEQVAHPAQGGDLASLTRREREVLELLGRGLSNRELADTLVVSEKTVKSHVSNILMKLGVHDRTQAALLAVRAGLVDAGETGQ